MPRIFLGNFDFEHDLARAAGGRASPAGDDSVIAGQLVWASRRSELFWAWLPVAKPDDFVIAPGRVDPHDFAGLTDLGLAPPHFVYPPRDLEALQGVELVPWGWTSSVVAFGRSNGWSCPSPPLEVVRHVNSRAFRFELEREWNVGLAGAAMVDSMDKLQAVLLEQESTPRGWLLKANFGMSGREALRGSGTILDEKTRNWARKRLAASGPIVFEPIVERIAEAGVQIEIPQIGPPQLVGVTPLLVDRSGVYRGSHFGCPASELEWWQPAVETGIRAAERLQRLGYFGPLGIDAMRYCDAAGEIRLRPLQDVNARHTMGRLALGFRRVLPAGWCGAWLHFNRRHLAGRALDTWLGDIRNSLPAETIAAATSPRTIGSRPVEHQAVIVLVSSPESRRQAEAALFGSLAIAIDTGDRSITP
ncbi:MAG: hypothetical protein ACM3U2_14960 [Deltaproteobacteria bacterium]